MEKGGGKGVNHETPMRETPMMPHFQSSSIEYICLAFSAAPSALQGVTGDFRG